MPEDTPPTPATAISLRKSLILFISEIQKETNKSQAGRDTEEKAQNRDRQTDRQNLSQPLVYALPHPAPTSPSSAGWGDLGSERCRTCPGATQQCQLPSLSYPISGSLLLQEALIVVQGQGTLGLGDPGRAQGQGHDGPGSLARPGLSLQRVLQLSQEAEKQVPGEFPLSVSSRAPSPASPGRGLGQAGPGILGKCRSLWSLKEVWESGRPDWSQGTERGAAGGLLVWCGGINRGTCLSKDLEGRERNLVPEL